MDSTLNVKTIEGAHFIIQSRPGECWRFIKTTLS